MISAQSTTELEVTTEPIKTTYFSMVCEEEVMLSSLGFDTGEGFRPFHPLIVKVDGVERALPLVLQAGLHAFELMGERFDGSGLLVVGYGLHTISDISIGNIEASLSAQVAAMPRTIEGDGPPPDSLLTGIVGTQYFDRLNAFWHKEVVGAWQQQP